jgi:hypothetical protein
LVQFGTDFPWCWDVFISVPQLEVLFRYIEPSGSPDGLLMAFPLWVILAHRVKLDQIANLLFRGLAKREVSNVTIGGRQVKIVRMQITAAGLKAIADWNIGDVEERLTRSGAREKGPLPESARADCFDGVVEAGHVSALPVPPPWRDFFNWFRSGRPVRFSVQALYQQPLGRLVQCV